MKEKWSLNFKLTGKKNLLSCGFSRNTNDERLKLWTNPNPIHQSNGVYRVF